MRRMMPVPERTTITALPAPPVRVCLILQIHPFVDNAAEKHPANYKTDQARQYVRQ